MSSPRPEPNENPNTMMLGPVYIFTDKAIVPPRKQDGPPLPPTSDSEGTKESPPAEDAPSE